MKHYFILISLFLFVGCQTSDLDNFEVRQKKYYKTLIEHSCHSKSEGSFSADVSTNRLPSVLWEGKWSNNFSTLQTQLLDPTGRLLKNKALTNIENKFGPKTLRSLICGQIPFLPAIYIDGHKIKIKSQIRDVYQINEQTMLETTSEFFYGLFSKKSQITLLWKGMISQGEVKPISLNIGSSEELITLNFIDYE